jgi:hypothetical protein
MACATRKQPPRGDTGRIAASRVVFSYVNILASAWWGEIATVEEGASASCTSRSAGRWCLLPLVLPSMRAP